jgi:hypothetical protein
MNGRNFIKNNLFGGLMIQLTLPIGFEQEKKYICHVLFREFLGVNYILTFSNDVQAVEIKIKGGFRKVIIADEFFSKVEGTYLKEELIPRHVLTFSALEDSSAPIIYGGNLSTQNEDVWFVGLDILASSFFMLTRWEEVVIPKRDIHGRFKANESLAYKHDFLHRPVVNEYVEILREVLEWAGASILSSRKPELVPTHDIDSYRMWGSPKKLFGRLKYYINDKKPLKWWLSFDIPSYVQSLLRMKKDPYDTFDEIMDLSADHNVISYFMLMDYGKTKFDRYYKVTDNAIQELIGRIKSQGHEIGFHPSYGSFNHQTLFDEAYKEVQSIVSPFGRQHFLRFDPSSTWRIWDQAKLEWDSTVYYAEAPGFRCGTCYTFTVYDVINREQLTLKEKPMCFMEHSFMSYLKLDIPQMKEQLEYLMKQVVKYDGEFVFLWHNATFNAPEHRKYKEVYSWIFKRFKELKENDV